MKMLFIYFLIQYCVRKGFYCFLSHIHNGAVFIIQYNMSAILIDIEEHPSSGWTIDDFILITFPDVL